MTESDPHQLLIEMDNTYFEPTRNFAKDGDWQFTIGIGNDYPGDKGEGYNHNYVPNNGDEEERLGWNTST